MHYEVNTSVKNRTTRNEIVLATCFFLPFCSYHNLCNVIIKQKYCSVLGKGATGAVFQGVNKHNGETVAVIAIIIIVVFVIVVVVVMGEQGLCRAEKMLR